MEFRLANIGDLERIKEVYKEIILSMNKENINIWDEVYPCEYFEEDIRKKQLYILTDYDDIVSAFALTTTNAGESAVKWTKTSNPIYYLDRLGVNIKYLKKGIGSYMLSEAKEISKNFGAKYLRLFVVDINEPAIRLYLKNGFKKVDGIYEEKFDDGFVLNELGYEIRL